MPVVIGDEHHGPPADGELRFETDLLIGKPRADVHVIGSAHAAGGEPATDWTVGLRVGELSKALHVTGPRFWERSASGHRLTRAPSRASPSATASPTAARGAAPFGVLLVWGKKSGASLRISCAHGLVFPNPSAGKYVQLGREDFAMQMFFESKRVDLLDLSDEGRKPLFARALKKLGPLAHDEVYGFEPALALGGKATLANLRTVKIIEHLEILAQLAPPRIVENPLL